MKKQLLGGLTSAVLTAGLSVPAMAELSATGGFVSDYVYRGTELGNAAAYASLDYEWSGFYAGTWAIMDGGHASSGTDGGTSNLGTEIDYYFGYGMDLDNSFNFTVGYTAYTYSYNTYYLQDFEDEIGGTIGFMGFGASAYYGWIHQTRGADTHSQAGETVPYMYFDLNWTGEVFGVLVGRYETDPKDSSAKASYNYFELSASGEVATLDMSLTYGKKFSNKLGNTTTSDTGNDYIVLDISKTFSL